MSFRGAQSAGLARLCLRRSRPGSSGICVLPGGQARVPSAFTCAAARSLPYSSRIAGRRHQTTGSGNGVDDLSSPRSWNELISSPFSRGSLQSGRCFSGRAGVRDEEPVGREGDTKASSYSFLPPREHERLSAEAKQAQGSQAAAASAATAAHAEVEDRVDFSNMTMWQRVQHVRSTVKVMWSRYGLVFIGTNAVLYVGGLGALYTLLSTGLVAPDVDISDVLQRVADFTGAERNATVSEYVKRVQHLVQTNKEYEHFVMAFVANELLELPRNAVAIIVTPSLARALGRAPAKVPKN